MASENIHFTSQASPRPPVTNIFLPFRFRRSAHAAATQGLSGHVRKLRKKNQGISRWLLFAVLGGTVLAFALVQFGIL
jgi:hypothetical protein